MIAKHIEITDFAHGGVGVGRIDERVVFVRGALPGEIADVEITQELSSFLRGKVLDVQQAHPQRIPVLWKEGAAGVTGAADLSHASLDLQHKLKTQVLLTNLRRIGGEQLVAHLESQQISPTVVAPTTVADDGWHTRTRFDVVKLDDGWGMNHERSHDVVPLDCMPLAVRDLETFAFDAAWDDVVTPGTKARFVAPASGPNVVVMRGKVYEAPGVTTKHTVTETVPVGDQLFDYDVHADGFWQIHYAAPRTLAALVLEGAQIRPGDSVLELFSGAGLFSVPLAQATGELGSVDAVEGAGQAVKDAKANLSAYPWANSRTARIDASFGTTQADVVVADPPRKGLGVELAKGLARSVARRIVLVSCDPAAAARDVAAFVGAGRTVVSMEARDIFPHTHHFEVVTVVE